MSATTPRPRGGRGGANSGKAWTAATTSDLSSVVPATDASKDIEEARRLAAAGVPIFLAEPALDANGQWDPQGGSGATGYRLPKGWQQTVADPAVLDDWRPGMAVCAVMGHGLDGLDFDPRSGGRETFDGLRAAGMLPTVYGTQTTPSGGVHGLVATLGERSKDGLRPGLDVKAGVGGEGRGFLFLAPTVRRSKVDGTLRPYRWTTRPDLERLTAEGAEDDSGASVRDMIRASRKPAPEAPVAPVDETITPEELEAGDRYVASVLDGVVARLQEMQKLAKPDPRDYEGPPWDDTVYKESCTVLELANSPWNTFTAEAVMNLILDHAPRDRGFGEEQITGKWRSAVRTVGTKGRPKPKFHSGQSIFDDPDLKQQGHAPSAPLSETTGSGARYRLDVSNDSVAARWLARELGRGPLAGVFRRGDSLVRVPRIDEDGYAPADTESGKHDGPAQVRIMNAGHLAAMIHGRFDCYRVVMGADRQPREKPALFPMTSARTAVDGLDDLRGVRWLRGVTHTPMIRRDGTVLDAPGYDEATGYLYLPDRGLTVPRVSERPTGEEVARARALLLEMVQDFDFITPSDRANFIGTLASPLLRNALPGPLAGVVIEAPQRGSGKSLLANLYGVLHGVVTRIETPPSEAEMEKELGAILDTTTAPVVHFDNVTGTLRSAALAGVLTSEKYGIRRLGTSERIETVNDRMFIFTGNNLSLGGDLVRRMIHVRIDPGVPQPELRTGFRIPDLKGWAEERRGDLLWALLTIVRAWYADGRPGLPSRSRADTFARVRESVGGMLAHAGIDGTFDAQETKPDDDGEDSQEWATFLAAVQRVFGHQVWRARDVVERTRRMELAGSDPSMGLASDELPADLGARHNRGDSVAKSLGRWLANHRGQWAGGYRVVQVGDGREGKTWRVESLGDSTQDRGFAPLAGFSEALTGAVVTGSE